MMNKQLFLYQLCDSSFPTGSFSHSYGFETYMEDGTIHDAKSFNKWLDCYLHQQLCYTEGLAICIVFKAVMADDFTQICEISQHLEAQCLAKETRLANQKIGQQFLTLGSTLIQHEYIKTYQKLIKTGEIIAHPAIVFALLSYAAKATVDETLQAFLMNNITTLIQNAVRGVPLGQTEAQQILLSYQTKIDGTIATIKTLPQKAFGAVAPGLEIAQMRHETLFARNFMS
jgi:Urease accessory protein UreF